MVCNLVPIVGQILNHPRLIHIERTVTPDDRCILFCKCNDLVGVDLEEVDRIEVDDGGWIAGGSSCRLYPLRWDVREHPVVSVSQAEI